MSRSVLWSLLLITIIWPLVQADCGPPALPVNGKVNDWRSEYEENATVEYHCELPEMMMIGGAIRTCQDGRWTGTVPKCVEELSGAAIAEILLADGDGRVDNFTNVRRLSRSRSVFVAEDESRSETCLKPAKSNGTKQSDLLIKFKANYGHINNVELRVGIDHRTESVAEVIQSVSVNAVRVCRPSLVKPILSPKYILIVEFACEFETVADDEALQSYFEGDRTSNITIRLANDQVIVCGVRIFYRHLHQFHSCGSVDVPLHGAVDYVQFGTKFGRTPYFRYSCQERFKLWPTDQPEVRCGINNRWLDEFPTCQPEVSCPLPDGWPDLGANLWANFTGLFRYNNGTSVGVVGAKMFYSCSEGLPKKLLAGDSVRECNASGSWTGDDPTCVDVDQLHLHHPSVSASTSPANLTDIFSLTSLTTACGPPGLPLYAKPTTGLLGWLIDVRGWYPNGTRLYYRCESGERWMRSARFGTRQCIDGRWTGKIVGCETNYGGRLTVERIVVVNKQDKEVSEWRPRLLNNTSRGLFFADVFDIGRYGRCAPLNATAGQRVIIELNDTAAVGVVEMLLRPGGVFGGSTKGQPKSNNSLASLRLEVAGRPCPVEQLSDAINDHTYLSFRCQNYTDNQIDQTPVTGDRLEIQLNPGVYHSDFDPANLTMCSLTIYRTVLECGTPDQPLHSNVTFDGQTATFNCKFGFEVVGPSTVSCSRSGRWTSDFPVCRVRHNVCKLPDWPPAEFLEWKQNNTIDNRPETVVGSVAEFFCSNGSLLIGPRFRVCLPDGRWSGSEAVCVDQNFFVVHASEAQVFWMTPAIVGLLLTVAVGAVGGLLAGALVMRQHGLCPVICSKKVEQPTSNGDQRWNDSTATSVNEINSTIHQLASFEINRINANVSIAGNNHNSHNNGGQIQTNE